MHGQPHIRSTMFSITVRRQATSQTTQHKLHQAISTSPIFATHSNGPIFKTNNLKKKLVNFKFWSAAGLLRSIFLVLLGICILGAAVLGESICFLSQHITHILSKIKHTSLRNFAVSLPFFQLPRRCNKSLDRSQSA